MNVKRNLEGRVSSISSIEKKKGNARGCNTNDDLGLATERGAEGVVYKSLACATWTKGKSLILIEKCNLFFSQLSLLLGIIVLLASN